MIEYYLPIKSLHLSMVTASGLMLLSRGLLLQLGSRWGSSALLRYLHYTIDCLLLTAALMLVNLLPAALFANGWLTAKLILLLLYLGLALSALSLQRGRRARLHLLVGALLVYLTMFGIARTHHPLSWLA